jgi:hypothetical protein
LGCREENERPTGGQRGETQRTTQREVTSLSVQRFRQVMAFLFLWLCANIFWHFLLKAFTGAHPDSPAIQGLAADTIA